MAWFIPAIAAAISAGATALGTRGAGRKRDMTYTGQRPKDITEFATGKGLEDQILAAYREITGEQPRGRYIGMPSGYVDRATSPFIASREHGFESREKPALEADFASRGLSRSSTAGRAMNEAYAQKERDINELMANAYLADLEQRKHDTERYQNLGYDFSGKQADISQNQAMFDLGLYNNEIGQAEASRAQRQKRNAAVIGSGLDAFKAAGGFDRNPIDESTDLENYLKQLTAEQTSRGAQPFRLKKQGTGTWTDNFMLGR